VQQLSAARFGAEWSCGMNYWLVLGLLLAGCGVAALLTAAVYLAQLKKVKTDLQTTPPGSQSRSQILQDSKHTGPQRRSA
jgi:hypothetical protein